MTSPTLLEIVKIAQSFDSKIYEVQCITNEGKRVEGWTYNNGDFYFHIKIVIPSNILKVIYWWRGMKKYVANFIANCLIYQ